MIKTVPFFLFLSASICIFCACSLHQEVSHHDLSDYPIIPLPNEITPGQGYFSLDENTTIEIASQNSELQDLADYLDSWLQEQSLVRKPDPSGKKLKLSLAEDLAMEAYSLTITQQRVLIQGGSAQGVFYGIQSLLQLVQQQNSGSLPIQLPCVQIKDQPAFSYRGLLLDVGRHMFPVEFIKKYIDLLAQYKMNRFHWHLTEDQGWRIEIKQYPKLQEVAAFREETIIGHLRDQPRRYDGKRYGGYYTQEEVREIVQYAKDRFITIIPEIEMPGHAQAALAAYPELSCGSDNIKVKTEWGVSEEVYCPKEETFTFLENVLTEVMDLFPSEYIHIGGDECPKTRWKESAFCQDLIKKENLKDEEGLQSYFIQRMEKFLNDHGRQIIGWDEILEGGLAPNATVMSWRGEEGGIEAARQGHDVIMSPTSHCYLDYYQFQHPDEPLAIGGFLPIEKVYGYHPIPEELNPEEAKHILGVQGNLWTEYISSPQKAEYMAFPRGFAIAEVGWTQVENKNFDSFIQRLKQHLHWLNSQEVNTANPLFNLKSSLKKKPAGNWELSFSNLAKSGQIRYTTDGTDPTTSSLEYSGPFLLDQTGVYKGQTFVAGKASGSSAQVNFRQHLATNADLNLKTLPSPKYIAGGPSSLINGMLGSNDQFNDQQWLGFAGDDIEAEIELKTPEDLKTIQFRFFHAPAQWIYAPKSVEVRLKNSPNDKGVLFTVQVQPKAQKVYEADLDLKSTTARYLAIKVPNYGIIPASQKGAGNPAWLFIDEIILN